MELTQEQVTLAGFQTAIGPVPTKQFAHGRRYLGQGKVGELARDLTNQRQFILSQGVATEGHSITNCDWHRMWLVKQALMPTLQNFFEKVQRNLRRPPRQKRPISSVRVKNP